MVKDLVCNLNIGSFVNQTANNLSFYRTNSTFAGTRFGELKTTAESLASGSFSSVVSFPPKLPLPPKMLVFPNRIL